MSLPKPPPAWASLETNYPAGSNAWNGQPCKVAPSGDIFTPNSKISAEVLNYILNEITTPLQEVLDGQVALAVSNWQPQINGYFSVGAGLTKDVLWDSYRQRWIADFGYSGAAGVPVSYDGGNFWSLWGTVKHPSGNGPMACNSADGGIISVNFGASGGVTYWPGSTGVGVSNTIASFSSGVSGIQSVAINFNAIWNVLGNSQSSHTFGGLWATSPDGTTWTDRSSSLPTNFLSGTSNVIASWVRTASPSILVVGANDSFSNKFWLMTSTTGTAFADVTPSLASACQCTGLHYSTVDSLFGILTYDGTNSYLYTTPTPQVSSSWTLVKTFAGYHMVGLSSLGRVWIVDGVGTVAGTAGTHRMLLSNSVASQGSSAVWAAANFLGLTAGGSANPPGCIRSSTDQILLWNDTYSRAGFKVGLTPVTSAY